MSDYKRVQEALEAGAEPKMLCATCPWDRYCIQPPSMTQGEIDAMSEKARVEDEKNMQKQAAIGGAALPISTLMTTLAFGDKATSASICPVFAVRLRSSNGRTIVDSLKQGMQLWDDQS